MDIVFCGAGGEKCCLKLPFSVFVCVARYCTVQLIVSAESLSPVEEIQS